MRILITGASSFTGMWFARALADAGHAVTATLRGSVDTYKGVRGQRVQLLKSAGITLVEGTAFGDEAFLGLLKQGYDVLCHHGANVENYKSMDFDVTAALADNTRNLRTVLETGNQHGLRSVVLTGSVFEQGEGAGNEPMRAFSPYGLSKGLTSQVFAYWCEVTGVPLYKFVIPNPFGPYEEPRFCAYLMRCWSNGKVAQVNTPSYVRDNIHVDLLALAYADFVARSAEGSAQKRCNPSGYVETQGAFATRFANEIGRRLGIKTPLELANQTDFAEPFARINTDRVDLNWNEAAAWEELAAYYRDTYLSA